MSDSRARLRRSMLLVPRFLAGHSEESQLSLKEIASAMGVSSSVIREDMDALSAVEFDGEQLPNYFAFELSGDKLIVTAVPLVLSDQSRPARLTEPEASALLGFLDELEVADDSGTVLDDLATAIAGAAGAPTGLRSWFSGGPIPAETVFKPLLQATTEGRRCRITYTASGGASYSTLIDPYHLRMERGMWYVIARLAEGQRQGDERVFRIDKIAEIEVFDNFSGVPIDIDRYSEGVFLPTGEPRVARVAFSPAVAEYAIERWGAGLLDSDGWTQIDMEYFHEGWLERTLAVFGGQAKR
ncbi:MAG: WYL domain-containing protein [Actinobacteria bacterium]|nr:WYL domain-containing protein [Actinomycetota bacterium]